jgi:hypothetical protein
MKIESTRTKLQAIKPPPATQIADLNALAAHVRRFKSWVNKYIVPKVTAPTSAPEITAMVAAIVSYGAKYDARDIDPLSDAGADLRKLPGYAWLQAQGLAETFEARIVAHLESFQVRKIRLILEQIVRFSSNPRFEKKVRRAVNDNSFWSPNHGFFFEIGDLQSLTAVHEFDVKPIPGGKPEIDVLTGTGMLIDQKYAIELDPKSATPRLKPNMQAQINAMIAAVGTDVEGIRVVDWKMNHVQPLRPEVKALFTAQGILSHFSEGSTARVFK